MRKTLIAIAAFVLSTAVLAQDANAPTAADLAPLTAAVRDYYRAQSQYNAALLGCTACQAAKAAQQEAVARAQAVKAQLEQQFGGTVDLETSTWAAPAQEKR